MTMKKGKERCASLHTMCEPEGPWEKEANGDWEYSRASHPYSKGEPIRNCWISQDWMTVVGLDWGVRERPAFHTSVELRSALKSFCMCTYFIPNLVCQPHDNHDHHHGEGWSQQARERIYCSKSFWIWSPQISHTWTLLLSTPNYFLLSILLLLLSFLHSTSPFASATDLCSTKPTIIL